MTRRLYTWAFLLFLPLCASAADVSSKIERVVIYPYGATVTRSANLSLAEGSNTIRLIGLAPGLEADEIRVELDNKAVEIGQVKLSEKAQRESISERVRELQSNLEDLKDEIQTLDDSSKAAKLRLQFISGISQGYAKEAWFESTRGSSDITSWKSALALIQSGSDDANKLIRDNKKKKQELQKDVFKLRRELANARGKSRANSEFEITLLTNKPGNTTLRLHYQQEEAYWTPHYEARLDSNSGKLRLAQQAIIEQHTEENWSDVELTLSTSEPSGQLSAPELHPEFFTLREPYRRRAYQGSSVEEVVIEADQRTRELHDLASVSALDSEKLADAGIENVEDVAAYERARIGSFAVNYEIPGVASVPNNSDEELTFDLAQFEFNVELITQIVPREINHAFLGAKFEYEDDLPMYSGKMTVFVDGIYVGNTTMPGLLPEAEAVLPMGQDRRIELKVSAQGNEESNQGVIKKRKAETTDYIYEIINRRISPTEVEVFDRYPTANHSDIKISVTKNATEPTERDIDNKPGVIVWRKKLDPNEKWVIRHGYTLSYPSKLILVEE